LIGVRLSAGVVVVGAGPGGYAAAMALARSGFKDIRVLERAPSADTFIPTKAFMYALFPPGKNALRHLGMENIDEAGVRSSIPYPLPFGSPGTFP
jgi:kynurenine 3-monooxygenase